MVPPWTYGNGWLHYIDLGAVDGPRTLNDIGPLWTELCRLVHLIGEDVLRITTRFPAEFRPGYFSQTKLSPPDGWWDNPNPGNTPRNAAVWNDPVNQPYSVTPTNYVIWPPGYAPQAVAHQVVHELAHLLFWPPQDQHNNSVGWVFNPNMQTQPDIPIITPVFGQWLRGATMNLMAGYRLTHGAVALIPDPNGNLPGGSPPGYPRPPVSGPALPHPAGG